MSVCETIKRLIRRRKEVILKRREGLKAWGRVVPNDRPNGKGRQ